MKALLARVMLLLVFLWPMAACAEVHVSSATLQQGLFHDESCQDPPLIDSGDMIGEWNECYCEAEIDYPVISGLDDPGFERLLNKKLKEMAKLQRCKGKSVAKMSGGVPSGMETHYNLLWQDNNLLSIVLTYLSYTGAYHYGEAGIMFDLKQHKILSVDDIIAPARQPEFNRYLHSLLLSDYKDYLYQNEDVPEVFLANGKCGICELRLDKDGLVIAFKPEVISRGMFSVPIPLEFITYPAIRDIMNHKHSM